MNNSTKEAITDYFANAKKTFLLSLFNGTHWSPELSEFQTIVKNPDSEKDLSMYLRMSLGYKTESLLGWMVSMPPYQNSFMN